MTDFEAKVFAATYSAAFAHYAASCAEVKPSGEADDNAAVIASDLARRAVEA